MGQAKLKAVRKLEKIARAGSTRLTLVQLVPEITTYDAKGRMTGRQALQPVHVVETEIPEEMYDLVRRFHPKVKIEPFEKDG